MRRSFGGIILAFFFVPGAVALLFWNEGRAVKTAKSLKEGEGIVIAAQADSVNPAYDQKLVHVTSSAATDDILTDPVFGISTNAIRLSRSVQMYQWKENKQATSHSTTGNGNSSEGATYAYSYEKSWESEPINSSTFNQPEGHANPPQMLGGKFSVAAKFVDFGAFKLGNSVISHMQGDVPFVPDTATLAKLPPLIKEKAQIAEGGLYIGGDWRTPAIGDQKVHFTVLKPGVFSIVARQSGDTFEPYATRAGRDLLLVEAGYVTAAAMFQNAETRNKMMTWGVRVAGVFAMFLGLMGIFSPIRAVAHLVPIIGEIISMGTALAALLISIVISLCVIAVAWITYRPLLGGAILILAIAAFVLSKHLGSRTAAAKAGPAPAT